jgi:SAM-dependent methyltransferase
MITLKDIFKDSWRIGLNCVKTGVKQYNKRDGSTIYGELNYSGIKILIKGLQKIDALNSDSIFYDVGSGTGKIPFGITKMIGCLSTGIELVKERHEVAVENHNKYLKEESIFEKVNLINARFQDVNMMDATVVYVDNTLFDNNVMLDLIDMLPHGCLLVTKKHIGKVKYTEFPEYKTPGIRVCNGYSFTAEGKCWNYQRGGRLHVLKINKDEER